MCFQTTLAPEEIGHSKIQDWRPRKRLSWKGHYQTRLVAKGHPVRHPRRLGKEPGGPELWTGGQEGRARISPGHALLKRKINQLLRAKHGTLDCALISSLYPIHNLMKQMPLRCGRPLEDREGEMRRRFWVAQPLALGHWAEEPRCEPEWPVSKASVANRPALPRSSSFPNSSAKEVTYPCFQTSPSRPRDVTCSKEHRPCVARGHVRE